MLLAFVSYLPVIDKDSSKLWLSKAEKDNDFISVFFSKKSDNGDIISDGITEAYTKYILFKKTIPQW